MASSSSSASGVSESCLREYAQIESDLWKLFEVPPEPLEELFFRNHPFRISELGYAMLQNRFPRAEIMTRPSLAQAVVRGIVELRGTRNTQMSARSPCLGGVGKRGSSVGAGVVMGYRGVFTPTKAKII